MDILFYDAFKKMKFRDDQLLPIGTDLIGFTGDRLIPKGYIEMQITLGTNSLKRTENAKFTVVEIPSAYNIILGKPTLNTFGAVVSTPHLVMKFFHSTNRVVAVRGDQRAARKCYNISLHLGLKATPEWPWNEAQNPKNQKKRKEGGVQTVAEGLQRAMRPVHASRGKEDLLAQQAGDTMDGSRKPRLVLLGPEDQQGPYPRRRGMPC